MGSFRVVQRCADDGAHGSVVWGRRAGLRGGESRGAALFEWIDAGEGRGWREDGEEGEDGLKREARCPLCSIYCSFYIIYILIVCL